VPVHSVTITKGFWIGQTLVTAGAYKRFAGATGRQMSNAPGWNQGWTDDNMPIVNVTWFDAQTYCGWIGGRLPTEAEWEYAARGGSTQKLYGPLDEIAWYGDKSGPQAKDVGQKLPNGFGLYDILGDVWQWVYDRYDGSYYRNSPAQDPQGPTRGGTHVLRGGYWYNITRKVSVSCRGHYGPTFHINISGFRCAGETFKP
jgi:formylglycine-generating enzyme required for sulfatase activity